MTQKINRVLVAIDFQPLSLTALEQSFDLVRFIKGELHLIYVNETSDFLTEMLRNKDDSEKILKEASNRLSSLASETSSKAGLKVEFHTASGKAHEKILETARRLDARFIVIGQSTTYSSEFKRLGTNVSHIIGESKCPVLVIHNENHKIDFSRIVLPLDLTQHTREKIFTAVSFGLYYNATINIVSVLMGSMPLHKSRIFKKMKLVQKLLQENGVNSEVKLFQKSDTPVYEVIVDYAHEIKAGMIMIMTHQENSGDNYIGSVAQKIITSSDVPVLSLTSAAIKEESSVLSTLVNPLKIIKNGEEEKRRQIRENLQAIGRVNGKVR